MVGRGHGIGLGGLLLVIGVLYFTGAGAWLWDRIKSFDDNCYMAVAEAGAGGGGFCSAFGATVNAVDGAWDWMGERLGGLSEVGSHIGDWFANLWGGENFASLSDRMRTSMGDWISPSDKLRELMNRGPQSLNFGSSIGDRIRASMDSFAIGQHYLNGDNIGSAIPWLQQGARQPGYGIMSQLTLGDIYNQGAGGVQPDPVRARYYYQQAQQSLSSLQYSNSTESKQMLSSLPGSPQQISQQLNAAIGDLNKKIGK